MAARLQDLARRAALGDRGRSVCRGVLRQGVRLVPRILIAVLVGTVFTSQIGIVCTTVYLHRTVTHKAVTMGPYVSVGVPASLIWLSTGISPREWAAVHRCHHAFTDVEGDPHSPLLLGLWRVQLTNAYLYRKVARDRATIARYAKDLPADRWDTLLFDHDILGLSIGTAMLFVAARLALRSRRRGGARDRRICS